MYPDNAIMVASREKRKEVKMKNDQLIQSILRNTIELNEDRLAIKDREIARLMQQVADLKAKVNA